MKLSRTLIIALALTAALVLVTDSRGISSMSAERGVSADVVPDDRAFLGYASGPIEITTTNGSAVVHDVELVMIANRGYDDELVVVSVTHDVSGSSVAISDIEEPPRIGHGEVGIIEGDVECNSADVSATVSITITVETSSMSAEVSGESDTQQREFEVNCVPG